MAREGRPARFLLAILMWGAMAAPTRSVWDGVYTKEQARRGEAIYAEECARCHAQNLAGGETSPPLVGETFLKHWTGKTAGALYENLRKTMPSDDPGSLSTRQYADLVAFLFSANEFPAGEKDLDRDAGVLNEIRIDAKR